MSSSTTPPPSTCDTGLHLEDFRTDLATSFDPQSLDLSFPRSFPNPQFNDSKLARAIVTDPPSSSLGICSNTTMGNSSSINEQMIHVQQFLALSHSADYTYLSNGESDTWTQFDTPDANGYNPFAQANALPVTTSPSFPFVDWSKLQKFLMCTPPSSRTHSRNSTIDTNSGRVSLLNKSASPSRISKAKRLIKKVPLRAYSCKQGDIDQSFSLHTDEADKEIDTSGLFECINSLLFDPTGNDQRIGYLYQDQDVCSRIPRTKHFRSQQFVDRCNALEQATGGHQRYVYTFNMEHSLTSVYTPLVLRTQLDDDGQLINATRAGLCSYCTEHRFFDIKTSSYAQHLYLQHGILTLGKLVPSPIAHGRYFYHKPDNVASKKVRHTVPHYHYTDGVLCGLCRSPLGIACTGKTKHRPLVNYLRHFRDIHGQTPEGKAAMVDGVWGPNTNSYDAL